ncbi:MAG: hypothetical protein JO180_02350 [Gemmatirosa sp.]|nr:hypothetical protein [Gemmatirosa sp.]
MRHADAFGDVVAQITSGSERLVVVASRLPREAPVHVRPADERRLSALLDRARELAPDVARDAEYDGDADDLHSLCSAHFVSGAGWAWRVTAALVRARAGRHHASASHADRAVAGARPCPGNCADLPGAVRPCGTAKCPGTAATPVPLVRRPSAPVRRPPRSRTATSRPVAPLA